MTTERIYREIYKNERNGMSITVAYVEMKNDIELKTFVEYKGKKLTIRGEIRNNEFAYIVLNKKIDGKQIKGFRVSKDEYNKIKDKIEATEEEYINEFYNGSRKFLALNGCPVSDILSRHLIEMGVVIGRLSTLPQDYLIECKNPEYQVIEPEKILKQIERKAEIVKKENEEEKSFLKNFDSIEVEEDYFYDEGEKKPNYIYTIYIKGVKYTVCKRFVYDAGLVVISETQDGDESGKMLAEKYVKKYSKEDVSENDLF